MLDQDRNYHSRRAQSELRLAQVRDKRVAEAHLGLSSLHEARLRELDESCGGSSCGRA